MKRIYAILHHDRSHKASQGHKSPPTSVHTTHYTLAMIRYLPFQFTTKRGASPAASVEKFDRGEIRVECLRTPPGTTPELISSNLPALAKDHDTRMIVFGESAAHYICKVGLGKRADASIKATREVEVDQRFIARPGRVQLLRTF